MKIIRCRFYDAKQAEADGKPMTAVDRLIMLRSNLTHEEIQFGHNRGYISFSSTMADGANGCRFKYIQYSNPKRWRTLEFQVSDIEERILWFSCCEDADIPRDWQQEPGFTYTIYQGQNHIQYDLIGLMSFALEKSPSTWRNIQRWALWAWTAVIRPDPKKVWCSEECCKKFNIMNLDIGQVPKTEIDPQDSYDYKRNLKGVKEL